MSPGEIRYAQSQTVGLLEMTDTKGKCQKKL